MTTRECVHLVTGSYFWSRKKDGGHTIWSAVGENPKLHAHFTDVRVIFTLHGSRFTHASVALSTCCGPFSVLWPWPWPNDLHIRTWPVLPGDIRDVQIWISYVKSVESYCLKRQTYIFKIIDHAASWVVRILNFKHSKIAHCCVLNSCIIVQHNF